MANIPHVDAEIFIGLSYGDARAKIEGIGYTYKVVSSKIRPHWRTWRDYDPLNINLYVENNIVVAAYRG